jgi:hypothetical protein
VVGLGVTVGTGVAVGLAVTVGTGVAVGLGVAVGMGVAVGLGVIVGTGVGVGLGVTVGMGVAVGLGVGVGTVILSVSSVTAPLSARALPSREAPLFSVMLWLAMIVPTKELPAPSVAEVPTCQNRFTELPLSRVIAEAGSVVRAVPIWKWKVAFGSPPVSSVSVPVNCAKVLKR